MSATSLHTTTATATAAAAARPLRPPAFVRSRRAIVRLQASHVTRKLIDELVAQPEPRHGHRPTFSRLDELTDRYTALGGEPSDLLSRRRPRTTGFRTLRQALQARHDAWLRSELDACESRRAQRHEVGGDFGLV